MTVQSQASFAAGASLPLAGKTLAPVYLVDEAASADRQLPALLASWGYGPRAFATGEQFLAKASVLPPGVVLLADKLPGMPGCDVQSVLSLNHLLHQVIFCLSEPDVPATVDALRRGAHDVLVRPFDEARLARALSESAALLANAASKLRDQQQAMLRLGLLNARERSVLEGVLAGRSNKEMARSMEISHRTVEIHRGRLMRKLAADTVGDLFRVALATGILKD